MINLITYNPYRILGVYSNSSKKEITANKSKILAFARVGKSLEFPSDLPVLYDKLERSVQDVEKADSQITLPIDALSHGLFWYVNSSTFDQIALNNLAAGESYKANDIWSKSKTVSSLYNRIIYYLSKEKYNDALVIAEDLYRDSAPQILSLIGFDNLKLSGEDLFHRFIDMLVKDGVNLRQDSIKLKYPIDLEYIHKCYLSPIFDNVENAIKKAKSVKCAAGPDARLTAGKRLMASTSMHLLSLREALPSSDCSYKMLADKLANEILQCAIDYYNESRNADASIIALELMEYACSIAIGSTQKQRCLDNTATVREVAIVRQAILRAEEEKRKERLAEERRRRREEAERKKREEEEAERKRKIAEEAERKRKQEEERKRKEQEELERKREEEKKREEERKEQARIAAAREDMIEQFANSAKNIYEIEKILNIHLRDNSKKSLENKAFYLCTKKTELQKYIEIFPNGIYRDEAKTIIKAKELKKNIVICFSIALLLILIVFGVYLIV